MGKIAGLIPPAITVFDEGGNVDFESMKKHADYMIENRVDGIAYLGTSGEFGLMTLEQKIELITIITPYVKDRVLVLIGIGDTCLDNSLILAEVAKGAGADAVLAIPPYFSVYAEKNIEAYYIELAEQCKLPVIIYNFPELTGFDMNPSLVERLAIRCGNIAGIKDTIFDSNHLKAMLRIKQKKTDFSVFCAFETQAMEMIKEGVDGFINATANFVPQYTASLCQAGRDKDQDQMTYYWEKMCLASQVYDYATPLLLAVKEAVYEKVLKSSGYEKLPGLPLGEEDKRKVREILKQL